MLRIVAVAEGERNTFLEKLWRFYSKKLEII